MPSYTPAEPGTTLALVHGGRALLVESADEPARVAALLASLGEDQGPQGVLQVVTSDGIARTPGFAYVELAADGTATFLVRGDLAVLLVSASGEEQIDATQVTTWIERTVTGVTGVTVSSGTVTGGALPLADGAAWATSLQVGDTIAAAPETPAPKAALRRPPVEVVTEVTLAPLDAEHTIISQTVTGHDELADDATVVVERAVPDDSTVVIERAVRPPRLDETASLGGEHDGLTVMSDDIRRLRKASTPASTPAAPAALRYVLDLSTGGREKLEGIALIGRAPSASKVSGGRLPALIAIPGDQDISRNHVQLAVEGDTVVVTDLNSRNGTSVVIPGRAPQQLRSGEPTAVLVGTIVDLGGGVTVTVGQES